MSRVTGTLAKLASAAVWDSSGNITLKQVPIPVLLPGETLVELDLATVCGSDRHTALGRRTAPSPSILGHEGIGRVIATAESQFAADQPSSVAVGDRVVFGITIGCGSCDRCVNGRTAKCLFLKKIGHEQFNDRWALSGTYASHIVLPAGSTTVLVPTELSDEIAAPAACATATIMAVTDAVDTLAGKVVLVCGAGMLGLTAAAVASSQGAAEVIVTDPDEERLAISSQFGATSLVGLRAKLPSIDVAFELSGATSAAQRALEALAVGGQLVLAGTVAPAPPITIDPEMVVRRHISIVGVHNYEPHHLRMAVDFLTRTQLIHPWSTLTSQPITLAELEHELVTRSSHHEPRVAVHTGSASR